MAVETATRPHAGHPPAQSGGGGLWSWITTVDHKRIGVMYFLTSMFFFFMLDSFCQSGPGPSRPENRGKPVRCLRQRAINRVRYLNVPCEGGKRGGRAGGQRGPSRVSTDGTRSGAASRSRP